MKHGIEHTIEKFERDFAKGASPEIEKYADAGDSQLLTELVHTDLELRLTNGQKVRVESYLNRFPELSSQETVRELVLTEYNVRRNFDPRCRLEEYLLRFPGLQSFLVTEFLSSSTVSDIAENDNAPGLLQDTPSDMSARFRKKQLHEQGGLGNVWMAHDHELNRDVALKEIKSKYASSSSHRRRFDRESRITGKLEHPGIVPVYGQGQTGNGSPFFAMQFVRGRNFRLCIREFHESKLEVEEKNRAFNRLLQHFIDVCNTVEFAHSRNVIHRDIKPENIMIGEFGETFLIDWGLAYFPDNEMSGFLNVEDELENGRRDAPAREGVFDSLDGQTIGSPAFMSPEQARGERSAMGIGSDVYSLGATLFALVNNSSNPNRDLASCTTRSVEPVRRRLRREHYPLLSICDRAMAAEPTDRYSTVRDLRDDVENFLLDNPIAAHHDSAVEKSLRFLRRNRRVLNTALASLLLISLLSALAAILINTERSKAIIARQSESELRQEAEKMRLQESIARGRAEQRTRQFTGFTRLVADALTGADDAGLNLDLSKITSEQIIERLKKQIDKSGHPIGQALINAVVARGRKVAGDYNQSIEHYERALSLLEQEGIAESDPLTADFLGGLGIANLAAGKFEAAAAIVNRIKTAYEQNPLELEDSCFRALLIDAELATRKNDHPRALKMALQANELGQKVYSDDPGHTNLVWARYVLAGVHRQVGEFDKSREIFEQIVKDLRVATERHPLRVAAAVQLSELSLADAPQESIRLIRQASQDAQQIYGKQHRDAFVVQARLGRLLARQNDQDQRQEGIQLLENCRQLQSEALGPTSEDVLGTTLLLADAWNSARKESESRHAIRVLRESIDALVESSEPMDRSQAFTAALYDKLANACSICNDQEKAIQYSAQAVEFARRAYGTSSITDKLIEKHKRLLNEN